MKGFDIIGKLGEGAYSMVYKVRRRIDNKVYALKKVKMAGLNEKEKNNSLNEVRILASIKSPFIISYKEAFFSEEDKCLNLVMEYADKGDLYQRISLFKRRKQTFEEIDVWKIFIQICRGLKSLHDLKILHRDFKSANIFLFSDGTAKIGDLNVSKVLHKGLGHTQTGTPYYASPEVWNNEPYDAKSDIWSLACITYEMLTLNPPFRAESFDGLYKKVIAGKYTRISGRYSNDMNDLLKLLFKVNPRERPTCAEILKHPLIQKRIEYFKAQIGLDSENIDAMDDNELLKTIRLPKNLIGLTEKLPKPNYNYKMEIIILIILILSLIVLYLILVCLKQVPTIPIVLTIIKIFIIKVENIWMLIVTKLIKFIICLELLEKWIQEVMKEEKNILLSIIV